ncbi:MAG: hypothetical protein ACHRHE_05705 [Tepidisphaerales bacterium]
MTTQISPSIQLPWSQRINFRLWILLGIVAVAVGTPIYWGLQLYLTGGIMAGSDEKGELLRVDLKSMSLFDMDQKTAENTDIPRKWRDLDGKRVELAGEMYLGNQAGDYVTRFDLVFSIMKCCVTSSPKVQHFVKCSVPSGRPPVRYYSNLVCVKGILHVSIEPDPEGGLIHSVYRLDVESLRPG